MHYWHLPICHVMSAITRASLSCKHPSHVLCNSATLHEPYRGSAAGTRAGGAGGAGQLLFAAQGLHAVGPVPPSCVMTRRNMATCEPVSGAWRCFARVHKLPVTAEPPRGALCVQPWDTWAHCTAQVHGTAHPIHPVCTALLRMAARGAHAECRAGLAGHGWGRRTRMKKVQLLAVGNKHCTLWSYAT